MPRKNQKRSDKHPHGGAAPDPDTDGSWAAEDDDQDDESDESFEADLESQHEDDDNATSEAPSPTEGADSPDDAGQAAADRTHRRRKLESTTGNIREILQYPSDPRGVRMYKFDLRAFVKHSRLAET